MKKFLVALLAVVMVLTFVTVAACKEDNTVIVTLHVTEDSTPIIRKHVVGENDLPTPTPRDGYTFAGWYYDNNTFNEPFNIDNEDARQVVYAKWDAASSVEQNVNLVLNPNYVNAQLQMETISNGATFNLPTPIHPYGSTFDGWYTSIDGGTKWSSTTPITQNTTLYAHWTPTVVDLSAVLNKFSDTSTWNFADTVTITDSEGSYDDYYEFLGDLVLNSYEDYYGGTYTEYYDMSDSDVWYYIADNGDGTYTKYDDTTDEFAYAYMFTAIIDLSTISDFTFVSANGYYSAQNPGDAGKAILGDYGDDNPWTSFDIYISNGNITKIVANLSDGTTYTHTLSKFGTVNFELPDTSVATIEIDTSKSTFIEVGATVDYTQYFTVTSKEGENVTVTESLLDLTQADTSKEGIFTVTITYEGVSAQVTFAVVAAGTDLTTTPAELTEVLNKYIDNSTWNFAVTVTGEEMEDYYEYDAGYSILNRYTYSGNEYTDYLGYDSNTYYFFSDNGNGTYTKYAEGSDEYDECYYYLYLVDLRKINTYTFVKVGNAYVATNPSDAGDNILGAVQQAWTSLTVTVSNGNITSIVGTMDDGYTMTFAFSKHGEIEIELPEADEGGDNPVTGDMMESQNYNANTFDKEVLQKKLVTVGEEPEPYIGLPSKGNYNALVIPVKFSDTTISQKQLDNLNIAFNGTSEQTGWESVKTYYEKASYGNLKLSFDIAGVNLAGVDYYTSSKSSSYYGRLTTTYQGEKYNNGDNVLLHEVLAYYESRLDLTKYDTNNDGAIDAVYLIYSAPVNYNDDNSIYWAFVTWNYEEETYDGLDVYYYLFAGLGFMDESVKGGYTNEKYPVIDGLKVNAATYIHETGHLLGLDDYYDYEEDYGCNEGLGGADMMDYTVGDQNVYSKIMLGWLTPDIVTSTQTITIKSSQAEGDAILIPLKWDNSYFCEYLLIDLYSAQGLNELHAGVDGSYLYDGAAYGVRIYHVSSWINDPYNNDYESFTDYNNSVSDIALIKLVEADGENKFASSYGLATEDDLWQAGDSLNKVFPNYTRNDGKTLNFNVTIVSASATEATLTITYYTTTAAA